MQLLIHKISWTLFWERLLHQDILAWIFFGSGTGGAGNVIRVGGVMTVVCGVIGVGGMVIVAGVVVLGHGYLEMGPILRTGTL